MSEQHDILAALARLETELAALRAEVKTDFDALRADVKTDLDALRAEVKTDLDALRAEVKTDLAALHAEVKTDLDALRAEVKAELAGVARNIEIAALAEQQRRALDEMATIRADLGVVTAMLIRQDASLRGLTDEVRAMHRQHARFDQRLRRLEDAPPA